MINICVKIQIHTNISKFVYFWEKILKKTDEKKTVQSIIDGAKTHKHYYSASVLFCITLLRSGFE